MHDHLGRLQPQVGEVAALEVKEFRDWVTTKFAEPLVIFPIADGVDVAAISEWAIPETAVRKAFAFAARASDRGLVALR